MTGRYGDSKNLDKTPPKYDYKGKAVGLPIPIGSSVNMIHALRSARLLSGQIVNMSQNVCVKSQRTSEGAFRILGGVKANLALNTVYRVRPTPEPDRNAIEGFEASLHAL